MPDSFREGDEPPRSARERLVSLESATNERVAVVAYDQAWPALFSRERARLEALCGDRVVRFEHIGSTSVPELCAKPVIDILGGVTTMDAADALVAELCAHGDYDTSIAFNQSLTGRRWLMRHARGRRTHHLHLVVFEGDVWNSHVGFRDRLRADAALALRYEALKRELAERYSDDREAYTDAKSAFILAVL